MMNIHSFTATDAAGALAQIRQKLGPEAVVLNVRRVPGAGISRLWARPRIEVLAYAPQLAQATEPANAVAGLISPAGGESESPDVDCCNGGQWRSGAILERLGIRAVHAERVVEMQMRMHGEVPPETLAEELSLAGAALQRFWRHAPLRQNGTHLFIGPPGSGKTTALCKWLTQTVLLHGSTARVWRLDVPRANTAELLSVHCEILDIPLERSWNPAVTWPESQLCIDVPGVDTRDADSVAQLQSLITSLPGAGAGVAGLADGRNPTVTLVLNCAYDLVTLERQVRAFSIFPVTHLLFTHLDEEPRWSKMWNFVLGTNYSFSFLSAGQNLPGEFFPATADLLLPVNLRPSAASSRDIQHGTGIAKATATR